MFCTQCGTDAGERPACPACGAAVTAPRPRPVVEAASSVHGPAPAPRQRPLPITLLAITDFLTSFFCLTVSIAGLSAVTAADTSESQRFVGIGVTATFIVLTIFAWIAGIGLWRLTARGRAVHFWFAAISLVGFPIGTVIGGVTIWYLRKPEIKALFSDSRAAPAMATERPAPPSVANPEPIIKERSRRVPTMVVVGLMLGVAVAAGVFFWPRSEPASTPTVAVEIGIADLQPTGATLRADPRNLTERDIAGAELVAEDARGVVTVQIRFTPEGAAKMRALTEQNIGQLMGFRINGVLNADHTMAIQNRVAESAEITFMQKPEAVKFVRRLRGLPVED